MSHVYMCAEGAGHRSIDTSKILGMPVLWGERERSGRHYSDQQTVQHSVQQPGRTRLFLLSRALQTRGGWIGSAVLAITWGELE